MSMNGEMTGKKTDIYIASEYLPTKYFGFCSLYGRVFFAWKSVGKSQAFPRKPVSFFAENPRVSACVFPPLRVNCWGSPWTIKKWILFRKGRGTRDQIANILWIIKKAKEFQKKHLLLLYWLRQSLWLCGSPQTVKNSSRDGNTRPPDLPLEKSVCRSRSNS